MSDNDLMDTRIEGKTTGEWIKLFLGPNSPTQGFVPPIQCWGQYASKQEQKQEIKEKKMGDNEAGKDSGVLYWMNQPCSFKPITAEALEEHRKQHMKEFVEYLAKPARPVLDKEAVLKDLKELEDKYRTLSKWPTDPYCTFADEIGGTILQYKRGTCDLPKRWVLNRTFTYSEGHKYAEDLMKQYGLKSEEKTMNKPEPKQATMNKIRTREVLEGSADCVKYTTYTWSKAAGSKIPEAVLADMAEPIKPAKECGCIDKAKMLDRLKVWMKTCNEEIQSAQNEGDFIKAARYGISLANHQHLEGMILRGGFDRAPCKPEPAPYVKCETGVVLALIPEGKAAVRLPNGMIVDWRCNVGPEDFRPTKPAPALTGEVLGFVDKTHIKVRLDDGSFTLFRCAVDIGEQMSTKPALDKERVLTQVTSIVQALNIHGWNSGMLHAKDLISDIEQGKYDLLAPRVGTKAKSEETCTPAKPALDKGELIKDLKQWVEKARVRDRLPGYERILYLIDKGEYDLPATPISTADLVEMLRARASLADGIDITDLRAYEMMTIGHNKPATVIAVLKRDKS